MIVASANVPSQWLGRLVGITKIAFMTPAQIRALFEDAGYEVLAQHPVERKLARLAPTTVAVATPMVSAAER